MFEDVIIIFATPRPNGYSRQIAGFLSQKLNESNISNKVYDVYNMNINFCDNCGYCSRKCGHCKYKDDMQDLINHFDNSKATILISPVAFDGPMAKLKVLIERTNVIFHSKYTHRESIIDRNKPRVGYHIQLGGSMGYPSQFSGGDIINGFFFKSINAKLQFDMKIVNTDNIDPLKHDRTLDHLIKMTDEFIKQVNSI